MLLRSQEGQGQGQADRLSGAIVSQGQGEGAGFGRSLRPGRTPLGLERGVGGLVCGAGGRIAPRLEGGEDAWEARVGSTRVAHPCLRGRDTGPRLEGWQVALKRRKSHTAL